MPRPIDKLSLAVFLLGAVWALGRWQQPGETPWLRAAGSPPPPVRILRFYASVGVLMKGQTAQLCYGVENARTVRISPPLGDVYPSAGRCLEVGPKHTTHYTILAEGFDGRVAMQSLTLAVEKIPQGPEPDEQYAMRAPLEVISRPPASAKAAPTERT